MALIPINDFTNLEPFEELFSEFIFGLNLNHFYPDGRWNPENVAIFLDYVKKENFDLNFELGNEPNSYPKEAFETYKYFYGSKNRLPARYILFLSSYSQK